jgi:catechol 2,3-dioxygenase-like lactoylglutathione lyase family enzyme
MDMKLEVVVVPVSDIDRAKQFYQSLGFRLDVDRVIGEDRVVQFTPPGSFASIHILNAVFCVDCETISNSPHDACTICGSHSLIDLFRMLGGTLRSQKAQSAGGQAQPTKYRQPS